MKNKSFLEKLAKIHLTELKIEFCEEYQFMKSRKWRFDFAYPERMIAVEIEGGTYSAGRHTRGSGFEKDCEKYNNASLLGWRVFRFTKNMLYTGDMKEFIKKVLNNK